VREKSRDAAKILLWKQESLSGPKDAWRRANPSLITKWRAPQCLWAGDEPAGLAAGWEEKLKTQLYD